MIKFEKVSKQYDQANVALSNVSFTIAKGELAFLTGHSGAGKSTLLKLILAMEFPSAGELWVDELCLSKMSRRRIPYHRRRIGCVFQDHQLLFDHSVFDNVMLPLDVCGFSHTEAKRRARAALDKVGLLRKEKMLPQKLSGGEQQRVGIARAVVNRPQIILADEPTGNLDPDLSAEVMTIFAQFQSVGVSLLVATHDTSLLAQFQHRTLTLDHGQLVGDTHG